jgi:hypothetical protein
MPEILPSMSGWWNQRSRLTRLLVYAVAAILAFVLTASVGVVAALVVRGDLSFPAGERARPEEPGSAGERGKSPQPQQADTARSQQEKADDKRKQAAPQDKRTTYVHGVGKIQADAVETFLDSHEKLLRYDALTSGDIEKMQADQAALQDLTHQAGVLDPPQEYGEQYEVFRSAINEMHEATRLAYALAADPTSATQSDFEEYDRHTNEAATGLQRSNEILGRDFATLRDTQEVSPP